MSTPVSISEFLITSLTSIGELRPSCNVFHAEVRLFRALSKPSFIKTPVLPLGSFT